MKYTVEGNFDRRTVLENLSAIAIVRACRRISTEIGDKWLQQVLFQFESPLAFIGRFVKLSISTRSQIRHVRISGGALHCNGEYGEEIKNIAQLLELLPGLKLDSLTVLGNGPSGVEYDTIEELIRFSSGWKELRVMAHAFQVFSGRCSVAHSAASCQARQAHWQKALGERDGPQSGVSVVIRPINRSTDSYATFASRRRCDSVYGFGFTSGEHRPLDAMLVAKRGTGTDYAEKGEQACVKGNTLCMHNVTLRWPTWEYRKEKRVAGCGKSHKTIWCAPL